MKSARAGTEPGRRTRRQLPGRAGSAEVIQQDAQGTGADNFPTASSRGAARVCAGAQGGPPKLAVLRLVAGRAPPSLLPPKINFVWASSFALPCERAVCFWSPRRCLRAPRAQPLGAIRARGRGPVRFWVESRWPSARPRDPLRGPARSRVRASGWGGRLPAVGGGARAPREARGVPPPSPPGCPGALRAVRRSRRWPPCGRCPPRARRAQVQPFCRHRRRRRGRRARPVRAGCRGAIGPPALFALPPAISAK